MPLLSVLTPALGALLIAWTGERRANLREFWSVAAGAVMFALVASMIPEVLDEGTPDPAFMLYRVLPIPGFAVQYTKGTNSAQIFFCFECGILVTYFNGNRARGSEFNHGGLHAILEKVSP